MDYLSLVACQMNLNPYDIRMVERAGERRERERGGGKGKGKGENKEKCNYPGQ